jgi:MFS transporter, DHA2 family, glioxin efflux transporter
VDPLIVLSTGATDLRKVFTGNELEGVLEAYITGIRAAFALGLAGAAASAAVSFLSPMKKLPLWENEKVVDEKAAVEQPSS